LRRKDRRNMEIRKILITLVVSCLLSALPVRQAGVSCFAEQIKYPNVAGTFYPADPAVLSGQIDAFLENAKPDTVTGKIFALISPHAGYDFSGQVAAYGYKLVKDKPYKTVIVLAPSHYYVFKGVSVYPQGKFHTPLGDLEVDSDFTQKVLNNDPEISFDQRAFAKEHALEVQLPFLQKVLKNSRIVPIILGQCSYQTCQKLAEVLKAAIAKRSDVLVVASTDMSHGYDFEQTPIIDNRTLSYVENMDAQGLYQGLEEERLQLCGGYGVVATLLLAKSLGHDKVKVLKYTNSAEVTGQKIKGNWTVGYSSIAIDQEKKEVNMLNKEERKKLLSLARKSIEIYLKDGKRLELTESDPLLFKEMGAFVTLREHAQLRGCIGSLVGSKPLYLTVGDMAIEAAVGDPRFSPLGLSELKSIEIEISVLSPMEKVDSADKIKLGLHGVLLKRGFNSGVFLPQVATETGWTKEEFLSNLCSHKAGLSPDAWKDKKTELYIFSAEVFSETDY
jgi:AmmeMemoRadiSam system protein B/AmmeMemoRadiSam system protein A